MTLSGKIDELLREISDAQAKYMEGAIEQAMALGVILKRMCVVHRVEGNRTIDELHIDGEPVYRVTTTREGHQYKISAGPVKR